MPKMYIKRMKNSTSFINKAERNKKEETKKKKKQQTDFYHFEKTFIRSNSTLYFIRRISRIKFSQCALRLLYIFKNHIPPTDSTVPFPFPCFLISITIVAITERYHERKRLEIKTIQCPPVFLSFSTPLCYVSSCSKEDEIHEHAKIDYLSISRPFTTCTRIYKFKYTKHRRAEPCDFESVEPRGIRNNSKDNPIVRL